MGLIVISLSHLIPTPFPCHPSPSDQSDLSRPARLCPYLPKLAHTHPHPPLDLYAYPQLPSTHVTHPRPISLQTCPPLPISAQTCPHPPLDLHTYPHPPTSHVTHPCLISLTHPNLPIFAQPCPYMAKLPTPTHTPRHAKSRIHIVVICLTSSSPS